MRRRPNPSLRRSSALLSVFVLLAIVLGGVANAEQDPSTVPSAFERYRFRADFNGDGIPDVALSSDRSQFGKSGGEFSIYLGTRNGRWRYIGSIDVHPLAVHLEKLRAGEGILTVYVRSSGAAGQLVRYSITARGVKELSSKQIHPGDGGTESGRAEYARYFDDAVRLQPEISQTTDGKVTWRRYER